MRDASLWQSFLTVFGAVFVAELGDKTQLATMAFAADHRRAIVFAASASALVASAGVAVLLGGWLSTRIRPQWIERGAGALFILIGLWTLWNSRAGPTASTPPSTAADPPASAENS